MADYQLTDPKLGIVIRTEDSACIPNAPGNRDWDEYQKWLEAGGVPDPYNEPKPEIPQPTEEESLLYEHENRILALEGKPPVSRVDFVKKMKSK